MKPEHVIAVVGALLEKELTMDQRQEKASRAVGEAVSDVEHRGMAGLEDMLAKQPGGTPFIFDNGPTYNQFVVGPSGSGMSHAAAAEIVKSNCKMTTKLHIAPSGQES